MRESADPQLLISAFTTAAAIEAAEGAPDGAVGFLEELAAVPFMAGEWGRVLPQAVRTAVVFDIPLAERLIAGQRELPGAHTLALWSARGALAEVTGDLELAAVEFERAAEGWTSFGMPYEAAQAFMGSVDALRSSEGAKKPRRCFGPRARHSANCELCLRTPRRRRFSRKGSNRRREGVGPPARPAARALAFYRLKNVFEKRPGEFQSRCWSCRE